MPPWLLLLAMTLATFRLTRLIVTDDFPPIAMLRNWVIARRAPISRGEPGWFTINNVPHWTIVASSERRYWWLGELVSCHWCASAYVSAGVVGLTTVVVSVPAPVLTWLAVWGAGALLADRA